MTLETAASTSPVTTSPVTTSPVTTGPAANDLAGFARLDLVVAGKPWTVAVADTPALHGQGLMDVTELVGVDGMLFVFGQETVVGFYMLHTLIPLDIWYFDHDGKLVDMLTMERCQSEPCRTYFASDPFHYALETEVGRIDPAGVVELDFYVTDDS